LIEAALQCFDRVGYRKTTVREIAAGAGCSVAAVYAQFRSKQALLLEIVDATYTAVVAEVETAVVLAGNDPARRLEAAVWAQCELQMRHQRALRVAQAELGRLGPSARERALATNEQLTQIVYRILLDGAAAGAFDAEPEATTRALTTICGAVGSWYNPGGSQVPRKIARAHCEMAARLAGVAARHAPAVRLIGEPSQRRSA
jgi:AcrR family transcriptional regulator